MKYVSDLVLILLLLSLILCCFVDNHPDGSQPSGSFSPSNAAFSAAMVVSGAQDCFTLQFKQRTRHKVSRVAR